MDHARTADDEPTTDPAALPDGLDADVEEPPVVSLWLARRLRDAGLAWEPREGDRFLVPDREMDDRVFLVASMVVEVRHVARRQLIAFNGTTEWALDAVVASEALWLPGETDLRRALGHRFVALRRRDERWSAEIRLEGATVPFEHPSAVEALGVALLEVLRST